MNDYVSSISHLEQYLREGGAEIPADRRSDVEKLLANLRPRIGHLQIVVNQPGASVTIDDVAVGVAPLPSKVDVNPGRRKISAALTGRLPATKSIVVAGSDNVTVNLDVESPETRTIVTTRNVNWLPVALWAGTGVLAAGAIVTGVVSLNASSSLKDKSNKLGASPSELEDERSKMRTFGVAADVLTVSAVVAGAAAIYVTFLQPKSKQQEGAQTARGVTVRAVPTAGGMALTGAF